MNPPILKLHIDGYNIQEKWEQTACSSVLAHLDKYEIPLANKKAFMSDMGKAFACS